MILKEQKTHCPFFPKLKAQMIFYSKLKQFQAFKIAKFEFKVSVYYGLWETTPSCDRLK